jgi:lysophospholipase L1-like esterase
MTVLLLQPYGTDPKGATRDYDNATEAALVAQGMATYTSNPGSSFGPLTPTEVQAIRDAGIGVQGTVAVTANSTGLSAAGSVIPSSRRRSSQVRIATFGDSTAELGPTTTDITKFVGAMGASVSNISPERWGASNDYPSAYLVANGGVSGETTTQMIARAAAAASTTRKSIQDVIDLRPDIVIVRAGGINDLAGLTTGNYDTTVATSLANHRIIIQAFLSAGIFVIDEGFYAYSATTHTNPTLTRKALVYLNGLYAADALQYPGRCEFIDWVGTLSTPDGNYAVNCTQNDGSVGLHPSFYAQQSIIGPKEAAIIAKYFGASAPVRYQGPNVLISAANGGLGCNSLGFRTTAGVGGGPVPTGWTQGGANRQANLSALEVINGKRFFTILSTGTTASVTQNTFFPIDPANFVTSSGDIYGMEFDIYVADAFGGPPPILQTVDARFNIVNDAPATLTNVTFQNATALTARSFPSAFIGHVVFQPLQLPAVGTLTAINYFCEWITAELIQWKIGFANPRLVKIGTGGVIDANQQ